jgi:diamine N-acetyltransferase
MVALKSISREDIALIQGWPPYPAHLADLDYALRREGWLDQFVESPTTRRLAAWDGDELVGFSILTQIADGAAEFYIALHPERIGRGIGREVTKRTLCFGFEQLGLSRIYLKVRDWHRRAISLYESIGFQKSGVCVEEVQSQAVRFVTMEIHKTLFRGMRAPSERTSTGNRFSQPS